MMIFRETDVTQSMYAGHYPNKQPAVFPTGVTKLDFISRKMREVKFFHSRKGLITIN